MKKLKSNPIQFPPQHHLGRSRIVSLPVSAPVSAPVSVSNNSLQPSVTAIAISKREHHAIPPLQPQIPPEPTQNNRSEWQHLAAQADRINQLAAELEAAVFELKAIGDRIDYTQKSSKAVCEYRSVVVPQVKLQVKPQVKPQIKRHTADGFIVTTKVIDLFQAEREAQQLAQTLRQRTKTKCKPYI
jgi:hypothetical protein